MEGALAMENRTNDAVYVTRGDGTLYKKWNRHIFVNEDGEHILEWDYQIITPGKNN